MIAKRQRSCSVNGRMKPHSDSSISAAAGESKSIGVGLDIVVVVAIAMSLITHCNSGVRVEEHGKVSVR
jgi:hypothetical protein